MTAAAHFRVTGRVTGMYDGSRSVWLPPDDVSTDRRLVGHVTAWRQPAEVRDESWYDRDVTAWYTRGCVDLSVLPEIRLKHGGQRVGQSVALIDTGVWLDAVFDVDPGPVGDCILSFVDDLERVPLSATYIGEVALHRNAERLGYEYVGGRLSEIAVVPAGAFPDARVVGRTNWPDI